MTRLSRDLDCAANADGRPGEVFWPDLWRVVRDAADDAAGVDLNGDYAADGQPEFGRAGRGNLGDGQQSAVHRRGAGVAGHGFVARARRAGRGVGRADVQGAGAGAAAGWESAKRRTVWP